MIVFGSYTNWLCFISTTNFGSNEPHQVDCQCIKWKLNSMSRRTYYYQLDFYGSYIINLAWSYFTQKGCSQKWKQKNEKL